MAVKPVQWTASQKQVATALLSIVGSAILAGINAVTLNISKAPEAVNIGVSLSVFAVAVMSSLGPLLYNYLPAHWQTLIAAQQDTIAQLQDAQSALQETHSATVAALSKVVSQPVIQNAVQPSQTQSAPIAIHATTVNVTGGATATLAPEAVTPEVDTSGDTLPRMQAAVSQSQQLV